MSVCAICGTEENVFTFNVHLFTMFKPAECVWYRDYEGTGDPIPSIKKDSYWHKSNLCTKCAERVWGCAPIDGVDYNGYMYDPHPVFYYFCPACEEFHLFHAAERWAAIEQVTIVRAHTMTAPEFVSIYTSNRYPIECNLPPYTTAYHVPYTTQALSCIAGFQNGDFSRKTGLSPLRCRFCGRLVVEDFVDGVCFDCLDTTIECDGCGCRVHMSDIYDEDNGDHLCESCHDERREEEERSNRYLQDYGYKPSPVFYIDAANDVLYKHPDVNVSEAYFGIELEVDQTSSYDGEDSENLAEALHTSLGGFSSRFYTKYDGSLNRGVEIVSHPHTYAAHYNLDLWKQIMNVCKNRGYTSHNVGTCGLHFHISRNSLGNNYEERDDTACKMILLSEVMWQDFVKFSRRKSFGYCHKHDVWVKKDDFNNFKYKAKGSISRHNAVNICNSSTIEFRMIRGTLNYTTFIASLQFVYLLRMLAMTLSAEAIQNANFGIFIEAAQRIGFTEFITYCKGRGFTHPLLASDTPTYEEDQG